MDKSKIIKDIKIPSEIKDILNKFKENGFESYLVGGCVRDMLMGKSPKDWDITTNALPEDIQKIFTDSFYENNYGTVGVKTEIGVVEATPYRKDGEYFDGRHPENVIFTKNIEEDLSRRDFTINAIAYNPLESLLVDPFKGIESIQEKTIKCVGDANKRFEEDGLRIFRMIRFSAQLNFNIDSDTLSASMSKRHVLDKIAKERIRDEFIKIIMSQDAIKPFIYMHKIGILDYITPHLSKSVNVKQNGCHAYDVFEHLIRSLQCAIDKNYTLEVRLAALFHDIGKPKTKEFSEAKRDYTFYNHEVVGTKITKEILSDLKFSHETIEKVLKLVRWHMFFSDTEQITHSAVRRMIANVGRENIWELINLRICDRVGTGRPKEDPYRLRKYMSLIEEVLSDPTDVSMLKINGNDLIEMLHVTPGPKIGYILNILLDKCMDDPSINTKEELIKISRDLWSLEENTLIKQYKEALHRKHSENETKIKEIRNKYKVK